MATFANYFRPPQFRSSYFRPPQSQNHSQPRFQFPFFYRNYHRPSFYHSPVNPQHRSKSRLVSKPFRRWFPQLKARCFRCGVVGHRAKACNTRCFSCGEVGHKWFRCIIQKKENTYLPKIFDSEFRERQIMKKDSQERLDVMLLDPDVIRCSCDSGYVSFKYFVACKEDHTTESKGTDSWEMDNVTEKLEKSIFVSQKALVAPIAEVELARTEESPEDAVIALVEDSCTSSQINLSTSKPVCQVSLDLSTVRAEDFADFIIIDEFEDYCSEDEDLNRCPITDSSAKDTEGKFEDIRKEGKELYMPIDIQKFITYCCIQAVNGFSRLIRARARGSSRLSPFRSSDEITKSCYIECLRESTNPIRTVAPVSTVYPVSAKKRKGTFKPFRGLVVSGNVRRSPRLNKKLF